MACYFNDKKVLPLADFSQTDSFDSRRTANGEKILSPAFALVEKIKGKTVKSTNLIPFPYWRGTQTISGITYTNNADGTITINGTATAQTSYHLYNYTTKKMLLPVGTYTISDGDTSSDIYIAVALWSGGTWIRNLKNSNDADPTFTITQDMIDSGYNVGFNFYINTGKTYNNVLIKPMLNKGPTAQPYTPYFAGLKNATISGIKSTGKNLFDINNPLLLAVRQSDIAQYSPKIENGVIYNGGIYGRARGIEIGVSVKKNTDYTFSFNAEVDESIPERYAQLIGISGLGSNNVYSSSATISSIFQVKNGINAITVNSGDWEYIGLALWAKTQYSIAITNLQIEIGSSATDSQPYVENTYQLPESYELGEWDSINPIEKTITRGTRTITFNGTENWQLYLNKANPAGAYVYQLDISDKKPSQTNIICDSYTYRWGAYDYGVVGQYCGHSTNNRVYFATNYSSVAEWKTHLAELANAGNPLTVAYELQTPTTETMEDLPRGYTAHKDGTETYLAGETDNSEWGAIPEFTINYAKIMKEGNLNG